MFRFFLRADDRVRKLTLDPQQRIGDRLDHCRVAPCVDGLDLLLNRVRQATVGQFGQCVDGFDPDFLLRALQQRQQFAGDICLPQFAQCPDYHRNVLGISTEHLQQSRHGFLAADITERIDGPLANPPVLILGGLDQLADRPFILGLIQDLDGRAPDVFVFVLDEYQDRVYDLCPADRGQRIRRAGANPPVVIRHDGKQVFYGADVG